ncbi:MAG: dihydroorotate dehydrogenase (quinone) [Verrucomicrobia bacterium]|nr:MAG: dihydroorotate dehydrogenase (quinone) [Verrucomicrobiota bacterium]
MSWLYRHLLRPALFTQDAEAAHERAIRSLAWISNRPLVRSAVASLLGAPSLPVDLFGLRFPNPVGLAAGMDKNAEALPAWEALGFGFTELGAVTWEPQPGNPKPRLFRAVPHEAIVNRMGFNNIGAEAMAQKLADWRARGLWPNHPVGINLGKSKNTPLEKAVEDYANSFRVLCQHADFFVVNVSSPNTPGLRELQDKTALREILIAINEAEPRARVQGSGFRDQRSRLEAASSSIIHHPSSFIRDPSSPVPRLASRPPLLVKVAPDLTFDALDQVLELVGPCQISGIVATNTSITRPETSDPDLQRVYAEQGGLSGRPLRTRSTEVIRHLFRQTGGSLPVIGVGGVFNAQDVWDKVTAGASLVQVYTGLIYEGPSLAGGIVKGLLERLEATGLENLGQAVGVSIRGEVL